MNRTLATWLSMITALAVAALTIAIVGLVLGAKASDEKADDASVTQQLGELQGDVETQLEGLASAIDQVAGRIDQVAGSLDGLATEQAGQISDAAGQIGAAVDEIQSRLRDAEELLGIDEQ